MNKQGKFIILILAVFGVALAGILGLPRATSQDEKHKDKVPGFSHTLPAMDGTHLQVKGVEVTYAPGDASAPHSHPCPVIAYVTQGAIRSKVDDGPEAVYQAGQSFYEPPNGEHRVSANASKAEPAKLLAIFICDHATPLTVAVPATK